MSRKVAFLDRDGVINKEKNYIHRIEDFEFIEGVFEAGCKLNAAGFEIVIVTNQAGIARGYYTEGDYAELTRWMLSKLSDAEVKVLGVYHCPHHPDYSGCCTCRKPSPGMIHRAIHDLSISPADSFLVGDKKSDVIAGISAGLGKSYLVCSGHKLSDDDVNISDGIFPSLSELADFMLERFSA